MSLSRKECVPCKGGVPPLSGEELEQLKEQVNRWDVVEEHHISKTYKFPNFVKALAFVNKVGKLQKIRDTILISFWPGGKLVLQYVPTRLTVWQKAISSLPLRLTRFLLVRNHQGGFYGKAQGDDFQTLSF